MSDGAPPAAARRHRLRVVSWNIHGCLGTDRRYDPARIARLLDIAEFKRRQNPVGARVSRRAFGRDRRMPITNRYRGLPR